MSEIAEYLEAVKDRYHLTSDYSLAKQLGTASATLAQHPLKRFIESGVPVTLSTDDPAMFHTDLLSEYSHCTSALGLSAAEVVRLAEASFTFSFLTPDEKTAHLDRFRIAATKLTS